MYFVVRATDSDSQAIMREHTFENFEAALWFMYKLSHESDAYLELECGAGEHGGTVLLASYFKKFDDTLHSLLIHREIV